MDKLIESSRNMSFMINEKKNKIHANGTPHAHIKNNLIVGPYNFEQVEDFKYLTLTKKTIWN